MINSSVIAFEKGLRLLQEKNRKGSVSVKTILTILSGRGKTLLLIFIALFFSQIPIITFPFGLFIIYLGVRIAFPRKKIWLPKKFLKKKVPSTFLKKMLHQLLYFFKIIKRWTHPRYLWATQHVVMRRLNGIMIALVGVFLVLSPPIPMSGLVAFAALLFMGVGLLNDDAIYLIIGYGFTLFYISCVVLALHFFSLGKIIDFFK